MSFDTDIRTDLDALLGAGELAETVRYKADGGQWSAINAFVENEGEVIGIEAVSRKLPIFVTVSKTDVPTVKERRDVIEWLGAEYTVHRKDSQDAAGWRLYCVR